MDNVELAVKIVIPLIAAFIGAILAFTYQRNMEKMRNKTQILTTLMAYRNVTVQENDFIKALNIIDVVFYKDKKVIELLHKYISYTNPDMYDSRQYIDVFYQLLYEMGQCSGYKNLSLSNIREFYNPIALEIHYPLRKPTNAPLES